VALFLIDGRYGQASIGGWIAGVFGTLWISLWVGVALAQLLGSRHDVFAVVCIIPVLAVAGLAADVVWYRARTDPLVAALGPACRGEPVADAADATAPAPLRIVVLGDDGERLSWSETGMTTGNYADWSTATVQDAALVACVDRKDVLIESCSYTGSDVDRYADVAQVRVIAARTGKQVGAFELRAEPRECAQTEDQNLRRLNGSLSFDTLSASLAKYAAP